MPSEERYNTHNPVLILNIFYNVHGLIISIKSESMQYAMRETDLMFLFHNQLAQAFLKIFQKIFHQHQFPIQPFIIIHYGTMCKEINTLTLFLFQISISFISAFHSNGKNVCV